MARLYLEVGIVAQSTPYAGVNLNITKSSSTTILVAGKGEMPHHLTPTAILRHPAVSSNQSEDRAASQNLTDLRNSPLAVGRGNKVKVMLQVL